MKCVDYSEDMKVAELVSMYYDGKMSELRLTEELYHIIGRGDVARLVLLDWCHGFEVYNRRHVCVAYFYGEDRY